ncbi:hypothetical protein BDA99DRAFT_536209 [Phascolomyces articulosus]|uniref:Uncharacterized protein n=1 Tax=Phascolomyces articulosus TaxID=60185 RepID=A0AAD5K2W4_9FUNG|nr:hypothetical protein BDA99DRAFT_536209 [Phascolomyces articulosus]
MIASPILVLGEYLYDHHNALYKELGHPTFRLSKNILFGVYSGGSSHCSWVGRILNELSLRGHDVTYAASEEHLKFVEQYPRINTISLGPVPYSIDNIHDSTSTPRQWKRIRDEYRLIIDNYDKTYKDMQSIMTSHAIDAVICDNLFIECIDGARDAGIPLILTTIEIDAQDVVAPYINKRELEMLLEDNNIVEYKSFKKRFYMKFLSPVNIFWKIGSLLVNLNAKRNVPLWQLSSATNKDALTIVNNLFGGTERARSMHPLVEMIGPIFNSHYDPLSPDIQEFLDIHQRVVFVALKQHQEDASRTMTTKSQDLMMERIFLELLHMQEIGFIDGLIWDIGKSSHHHMLLSDASSSFVTRSGSKFNVTGLWQQHYPHVRLLAQAPQFSILKHPSTITFVSHGESISLFESLYAGKRTVIMPFFKNHQSGNAIHFESRRLGSYLRMYQHQRNSVSIGNKDEFEPLQRVIQDKDGGIQRNVDRYQTLIQIHAKHGIVKGADLVEEAIFTSDKDGYLQHRHDVARKLSFLKANNYDLYICLSGMVFSIAWIVRYVYIKILRTYYILLLVTGKINKVKLP